MGFSSQAGQVIMRKQTVKAILAPDLATAGISMLLRSGALGTNRELLIPDAEIGGGRDVTGALLGAVSWSGDYDLYARVDAIATLLQGVLGTLAAPVTALGVTTHTVTPTDSSTLPFYSIQEAIGDGLEIYEYIDAVVNTFHLEVDANGYLICTAGLIGAKQTAGIVRTDGAALRDDTPMFVGTNAQITFGGVTLPAKSLSLDINNNFEDDDFRLGSLYLGDLTAKRREVTASFGIRPNDSALWRQATYGAVAATVPGGTTVSSALVITCETYEMIGATAIPYSIEITIPSFILTPYSFEASGDDIIENDVEGQAVRPVMATPILTAVIVTDKVTVS